MDINQTRVKISIVVCIANYHIAWKNFDKMVATASYVSKCNTCSYKDASQLYRCSYICCLVVCYNYSEDCHSLL